MKIKDKEGNVLGDSEEYEYDESKYHLTPKTEVIHHDSIDAVSEKGHWNTVAEYPETGGKDVEWVVDEQGVEAKESYDEYIDYLELTEYTEDEIKQINLVKQAEKDEKHRQDLISSLPDALADLSNLVSNNFESLQSMQDELSKLSEKINGIAVKENKDD